MAVESTFELQELRTPLPLNGELTAAFLSIPKIESSDGALDSVVSGRINIKPSERIVSLFNLQSSECCEMDVTILLIHPDNLNEKTKIGEMAVTVADTMVHYKIASENGGSRSRVITQTVTTETATSFDFSEGEENSVWKNYDEIIRKIINRPR